MPGSRYLYFPVFVLLLGFFAVLTAKSEIRGDRATAALVSVQRELGGFDADLAVLESLPERRLMALAVERLRQHLRDTTIDRDDLTAQVRVALADEEAFQPETALLTERGRALVRAAVDLAGHQAEGLVLALSIAGPAFGAHAAATRLSEVRILAVARAAWFRPAPRQWIRVGVDPDLEGGLALRLRVESLPVAKPASASGSSGERGR